MQIQATLKFASKRILPLHLVNLNAACFLKMDMLTQVKLKKAELEYQIIYTVNTIQ